MKKKALGYTRLSQESDTSIERQKRHIREYCDEHGLDLEEIYDDGEQSSGFATEERGEYQALRKRILNGDGDAIVVNDKRRLARDIDEVMRLIPDLRTSDIELHTYQDGEIDLSDPMRAAIEILMAAAAYEEKQEEITKSINATKERVEAGMYQGRAPMGLQFDNRGEYLVPDEDYETIMDVFDLLGTGKPYTAISSETGVSPATITRIKRRGREFYEKKAGTKVSADKVD